MTGRQIKMSRQQAGFSYAEMLIATVIVMASLGPAVESLQSARLAAEIHELETGLHYRVLGRMEDVLAEPFDTLTAAAAAAGGPAKPSSYSDADTEQDQIVVNLSFYDVANSDRDDDFFTIADPNTDNDSNPYTGDDVVIDVAWVRVAIAGTSHVLESLSYR